MDMAAYSISKLPIKRQRGAVVGARIKPDGTAALLACEPECELHEAQREPPSLKGGIDTEPVYIHGGRRVLKINGGIFGRLVPVKSRKTRDGAGNPDNMKTACAYVILQYFAVGILVIPLQKAPAAHVRYSRL